MNYLSWPFLGEGIPFRYHMNETVSKETMFLYFWGQSVLTGNGLSLQIPAGDMHCPGFAFFTVWFIEFTTSHIPFK